MTTVRGYYLITGIKGLVLHDIVGALDDARPELCHISSTDLHDAAAHIPGDGPIKFAFVEADPDEFRDSQLSELLQQQKTKVFLTGRRAEESLTPGPYAVLHRPFTAQDILAQLEPETCGCT